MKGLHFSKREESLQKPLFLGFVSGEDGKQGLRGTVVDRSISQIKNAAISGFVSGMSQLAQAAINAKYYPGCYDYNCNDRDFDCSILAEGTISGASWRSRSSL